MKPLFKTSALTQSSLQCNVSLVAPVRNIIHVGNKQTGALFVPSSTSCVATSEDEHVHICSTPISTDVSLSISKPNCSTDVTDNHTRKSSGCHTHNSNNSYSIKFHIILLIHIY